LGREVFWVSATQIGLGNSVRIIFEIISFQSLYKCEVRLFRRISVGPFPNNNFV
jgi:hypothetical protein